MPNRAISDELAEQILVKYINKEYSSKDLSEEFKFNKTTILQLVRLRSPYHNLPISEELKNKVTEIDPIKLGKELAVKNHDQTSRKSEFRLKRLNRGEKFIKSIETGLSVDQVAAKFKTSNHTVRKCVREVDTNYFSNEQYRSKVYNDHPGYSKEFVKLKGEELFGAGRYNYSNSNCTKSTDIIEIGCNNCGGTFNKKAAEHITGKGRGCGNCNSSKGETTIRQILSKRNISFKEQKTFPTCVYKSKLRFDFFLKELNILIEFQGEQHFKPVKFFGGQQGFENRVTRDLIKYNWAQSSMCDIYYIEHDEDINKRMEEILTLIPAKGDLI